MTCVLNASGDAPVLERRKGDLWVLSNAPFFTVPAESVNDRAKLPWVAIVQSLWHGPNQDGRCGARRCSHTPCHAAQQPDRHGKQALVIKNPIDATPTQRARIACASELVTR